VENVSIGLSSWIVQDGNYPDFESGKEYRFALEFFSRNLEVRRGGTPSLALIEASDYEFSGEILLCDKELTVLDVGLKCYHDGSMPSRPASGQWVVGRLYLGVDPVFWFESHSRRPDVPNLTYLWRLHEILLETTPWEESKDSHGRRMLQRDSVAKTYRSVPRTRAWDDDEGHGHYVLKCELLGLAP
jgi:hypothetical protein